MAFQGDSIFWVEVEKVVPNPYQPRREFDESKLKELAESVRMYGILQPLTVTRKEIQRDDGAFFTEYELIAGERRLRASRLAGLAQVPVIIRDSDDSEQEKLELAIIENLQREDLNAVDRALAFQQLADSFDMTHDQVAKKVGRSRMYVSNTIRLLQLPEYMLDSLKVGDLSEGHARTLLMLKDKPEEQDVVYREILLKKLSVREVERIVRKIATDKTRKKVWKGSDPVLLELEKEFTDVLGTRVFINKTEYGGKVTIDYFSEEDLQKLLKLVRHQPNLPTNVDEESDESTVITSMADFSAAVPLDPVTEAPPAANEETEGAKKESSEQSKPNPDSEPARQELSEASPSAEASLPTTQPETTPQTPTRTPTPTPTMSDTSETDHDDTHEQSAASSEPPEDVNDAIESTEASTDAIADYVLERAADAGASAFRPNPEEKVGISAEVQRQLNQQMNELKYKEATYTPPAPPTPPTKSPAKDTPPPSPAAPQTNPAAKPAGDDTDDESDLYSLKGFSV